MRTFILESRSVKKVFLILSIILLIPMASYALDPPFDVSVINLHTGNNNFKSYYFVAIDDDYVEEFVIRYNLKDYIKVSNKTGENVGLAIETITKMMLDQYFSY